MSSLGLAIPNYERVDNVVRLVELHLEKGVVDDIVVCDDGSSSRTIEALRSRLPLSDDRVRLIENRENLGAFQKKARTVEPSRITPVAVLRHYEEPATTRSVRPPGLFSIVEPETPVRS